MRHLRALSALVALLALTATACSDDSNGADRAGDSDGRVIEVTMTDNAFDPEELTVEAGEDVTFRFTNDGAMVHEAFIGTPEEQDAHHAEMTSGDMDDHGDDGHGEGGDAVTVDPGETGELTHRFDEPAEVMIGCHEPGHYESGMVATVTVT